MSGLSLISDYGLSDGDSDQDDVPGGPRVSVKRTLKKSEDEERPSKKRLPLPTALQQMFPCQDHEDLPENHQGRIRSFSHVRGNWATYVYIPFHFEHLISLQETIQNEIKGNTSLSAHVIPEPHLSLTKVVTLKHHWIEAFVASVKASLANLSPFNVIWGALDIYVNEEGTRTFLGISLNSAGDLEKIVSLLDTELGQYDLPPYYSPPKFHTSLLWILGDAREELKSLISDINIKMKHWAESFGIDTEVLVQDVLCKTGNKTFTFSLQNKFLF